MQFKLFTISLLFVDINNTINDLIIYLHKISSLSSYVLNPDKLKMFNILLFKYFLLIPSTSLFHESNNSKVYNYTLLFLTSRVFGNLELLDSWNNEVDGINKKYLNNNILNIFNLSGLRT
jgi:hypothetical protein